MAPRLRMRSISPSFSSSNNASRTSPRWVPKRSHRSCSMSRSRGWRRPSTISSSSRVATTWASAGACVASPPGPPGNATARAGLLPTVLLALTAAYPGAAPRCFSPSRDCIQSGKLYCTLSLPWGILECLRRARGAKTIDREERNDQSTTDRRVPARRGRERRAQAHCGADGAYGRHVLLPHRPGAGERGAEDARSAGAGEREAAEGRQGQMGLRRRHVDG